MNARRANQAITVNAPPPSLPLLYSLDDFISITKARLAHMILIFHRSQISRLFKRRHSRRKGGFRTTLHRCRSCGIERGIKVRALLKHFTKDATLIGVVLLGEFVSVRCRNTKSGMNLLCVFAHHHLPYAINRHGFLIQFTLFKGSYHGYAYNCTAFKCTSLWLFSIGSSGRSFGSRCSSSRRKCRIGNKDNGEHITGAGVLKILIRFWRFNSPAISHCCRLCTDSRQSLLSKRTH